MDIRVERLETGMAWSENPPSRTRHLVGNLVGEPVDGDSDSNNSYSNNDEVKAKTAFILYRTHHETDENIFAGSREDILRRVDGAWKIAKRTIVLDSNVILSKNLSVFF